MIPVRISYPSYLAEDFYHRAEFFEKFLLDHRYSSQGGRQIMVLATQEYQEYLELIHSFSQIIKDAYSNTCAYCSSSLIDCVLPIHPIEKNRENPWIVGEIKNILPLCLDCKSITAHFKYRSENIPVSSFRELLVKEPNVVVPNQHPAHLWLDLNKDGFLRSKNILARRTIRITGLNSRLFESQGVDVDDDPTYLTDDIEKASAYKDYLRLWKTLKPQNSNSFDDYDAAMEVEADTIKDLVVYRDHDFYIGRKASRDFVSSMDQVRQVKFDDPVELDRFEFSGLRQLNSGAVSLSKMKSLGIIGENGTGKSTLINFISSSIRGTKLSNISAASDGFVEKNSLNVSGVLFGRKNNSEFQNNVDSVKAYSDIYKPSTDIDVPLRVAYISESRVNSKIIARAEQWLIGLGQVKFDKVASQLKAIFGISHDSTLVINDDRKCVEVLSQHEENKPLDALSSGYKSILSIVYNIYQQFGSSYHLQENFHNANYIVGVVLIDEIDLHLHPSWKIKIVSNLKLIFPDILFIFTTHDPLVLKGCGEGEIILVNRDGNSSTLHQDLPDISRYDADSILTSRLFGLWSSSSMKDSKAISDLYDAIKRGDANEISHSIDYLKARNLYGSTYREALAYICVDKSLANNKDVDIDKTVEFIISGVNGIDKD